MRSVERIYRSPGDGSGEVGGGLPPPGLPRIDKNIVAVISDLSSFDFPGTVPNRVLLMICLFAEELGVGIESFPDTLAGEGAFRPIRDRPRLVATYPESAGEPDKWRKVSSEAREIEGMWIQIHGYYHPELGSVVERKPVYHRNKY
jgi:hypothetical protein